MKDNSCLNTNMKNGNSDDEGDFCCLTLNGHLHRGILWFIGAYVKY